MRIHLRIKKIALLILFAGLQFCVKPGYYADRGGRSAESTPFEVPDAFGLPVGRKCKFFDGKNYSVVSYKPNLVAIAGGSCGAASSQLPKRILLEETTRDYLYRMINAAKRDGISLQVCSGYRSLRKQLNLRKTVGNRAAVPGYSEHHLGTAVDIAQVAWGNRRFRWLAQNAHHFGLILSFYRGHKIADIPPEANHWRFVGKETAVYFWGRFGAQY